MAAVAFLYVLIGDKGVLLSGDAKEYYGTALNVAAEGNLSFHQITADFGVRKTPLTHYPPLTSLVYAALIVLGVPAPVAPVVVALVAWPALLGAMGWLAYRLSEGSATAAACTVAVAAISFSFLKTYRSPWSEVIFLPLLVLCVAVLAGLHAREGGVLRRLALASGLLALLMLTRYTGGFLWLAVLAWWAGKRLWERQPWTRLFMETGILAAAVLPLAGWLVRNIVLTDSPLGQHTSSSQYTLMDGVKKVVIETGNMLWPVVHSTEINDAFQLNQQLQVGGVLDAFRLFYLITLGVAAAVAWRYRAGFRRVFLRSPVEAVLLVYLVGLYIVLQPFSSFSPINFRDAGTVLCLFLPWAMAGFALAPRRGTRVVLTVYTALNAALLAALMLASGGPRVIEGGMPPMIQVVADEGDATARVADPDRVYPSWLLFPPNTSYYMRDYHEALLRRLGPEAFVITNLGESNGGKVDQIFAPYLQKGAAGKQDRTVREWLRRSDCALHPGAVVVLFDWPQWAVAAGQLEAEIDRRCPRLSKEHFSGSVAYFPSTSSLERNGKHRNEKAHD